MRLPLRVGVVIGLAALAACGKDAPTPVDFTDPAAVSANLSSVDSAFDSDVFRSFGNASAMLGIATSPALRPVASLLETTRPELKRSGAHIFLPNLLQAQRLQAAVPNLSVAAAQGRIIPDSMYGRVFEWDATIHQYRYQGTTVANLNGVRFILYALGLDGAVVEPVTAIGTLDIIDASTPTQLKLHVLVKGPGGATTYVDYLATVVSSNTSATATASGFISNGLGGTANKTLSFDESLSVNTAGARIAATFALNNPAMTLMMNETFSFNDPNIVLDADFRLIQNGETIRTVGHITINTVTNVTNISVTVYLNGHPVASIAGNPSDPGTEWVDAGGEPLTIADLAALDHLFDAWSSFQQAVTGLLAPISTFGGA
jgi:hypothetical protein